MEESEQLTIIVNYPGWKSEEFEKKLKETLYPHNLIIKAVGDNCWSVYVKGQAIEDDVDRGFKQAVVTMLATIEKQKRKAGKNVKASALVKKLTKMVKKCY